ncbi:hypothetical protein [Moorena sp. SIO3B2]|uniref:hypothetical protein n=1 Tax=Moorena sp. SIO3B2 TaxID=2607827 RepID=UPI0013CC11A3|nr:hypothetical protein [Moorena sp. SIO3B2]NEP34861.1 hypothetical protein [Moorena sp. SIO3B2]NEP53249.1 hypothetical protein [Moorena sp. SIO3C2]
MANIVIQDITPTKSHLYELTQDYKEITSIKGGDCSAVFNGDGSVNSVTGCSKGELRQLRKLVKAAQ